MKNFLNEELRMKNEEFATAVRLKSEDVLMSECE